MIVPLFALSNAGIALAPGFLAHAYTTPVTRGVLVGYVVGKLVAPGRSRAAVQSTGRIRAESRTPSSTRSSPIVACGCRRLSVGEPGLKARCPSWTSSHGM